MRTVQLRHQLPDGSSHVDWMLDLDPGGRGALVTFRLTRRVDELPPGDCAEAVRIADHRRDYLTCEGEISGGRGHVTRLAAGRIEAVQTLGEHWAFVIRWDGASDAQRVLVHRAADEWVVEAR